MQSLELGLTVSAGIVLSLCGATWLIRWARKGGRGASLLGGALLLTLGGGLVPQQPQQRIEEAREQRAKKGAESGDPPVGSDGHDTSRIARRGLRWARFSGRAKA
jgi:hypothetical protein